MLKLIAMDLDDTLADIGEPILPEMMELLRQLQGEGIKLILMSGKPAPYLSGLIRQSGLKNIILAGDNGGVIYFNQEFPPHNPIMLEMTTLAAEELNKIRKLLLAEFGERIWIQPNQVALSVFSRENNIKKVYDFIDRVFKDERIKHLKNFKTVGALDILPLNIDKGVALKHIQHELNISMEDTAVIGDGRNDVPMFLQGKIKISFPKSIEIFQHLGPKIVKGIKEALKFLLELVHFERTVNLDSD